MYMPQSHLDQDPASLIAEALHAGWTYSKIREKGLATNDNQIALVKKEMVSQNIIIDQESRAVFLTFGAIREKGNNLASNGKKNDITITDPSHVNRIAGLGDNSKEIKTGGEVNTSEIIKAQNEFLTNEMKLALDIGIFALTILRHDVQLTKDQALDTEVTKNLYRQRLESSHLLGHDVHALDRERAENIVARAAINELQAMVDLYRDGFNACAANVCINCRTGIMQALIMRARLNGIEVVFEK